MVKRLLIILSISFFFSEVASMGISDFLTDDCFATKLSVTERMSLVKRQLSEKSNWSRVNWDFEDPVLRGGINNLPFKDLAKFIRFLDVQSVAKVASFLKSAAIKKIVVELDRSHERFYSFVSGLKIKSIKGLIVVLDSEYLKKIRACLEIDKIQQIIPKLNDVKIKKFLQDYPDLPSLFENMSEADIRKVQDVLEFEIEDFEEEWNDSAMEDDLIDLLDNLNL